MSEGARLPQGGRVRRDQPIAFAFNGRRYRGLAGDTLAAALLANGELLVARSWKYHRPRGIVAAGVEEPNALVQLGGGARTVPNVRATEIELHDGLVARSVNCWPGVERDLGSFAGWLAPLLPAGFYYKTFMWPRAAWPHYERLIRRAAGLGVAPLAPDPDRYDKVNAHCDVLVAGAGPAGLAAALAAARAGARVLLCDEQLEPGGSLLGSSAAIDGRPAAEWIAAVAGELESLPEVRVLRRATVFGYHDHNFLTVVERCTDHLPEAARRGPRERLWRVRARRVVLATGAHERPLVFADNDLPGVMIASALATYVRRYAVLPGKRVVVATNNDSAYDAAIAVREAGAREVTVVDARGDGGAIAARARSLGVDVVTGSAVFRANGRGRVEAVETMRWPVVGGGSSGRGDARRVAPGPPRRRLDCDLLAVSGGWNPAVHLHAQAGGRVRWDDAAACFVPGTPAQPYVSAGAARGTRSLAAAIAEGTQAGIDSAAACGFGGGAPAPAPRTDELAESPLLPLWHVPGPWAPGRGPKAFVDYQNDVTVGDIRLAAREGYRSIEHVKRYTALGFGTDQGKLGNINGMAIVAEALGESIARTGTTTFRPNYTPVAFGTIAGRELRERFDPVRRTPLHDWHLAAGAMFEDVGQWKRPWYYPRPGESRDEAVRRECLAVRNGVGILDASTLGKIDIQGPDAVRLLDWVYTNAWSTLAVGRCRYGLMLGEDGMVMDDGVTARLAEHRYLMSTTTGGAARVLAWMEKWLQTEWPHFRVYLTSVTDHWATLALAGPKSREVLRAVCRDVDLANAAFPFMSWRSGSVAGVAARILRISFSGELGYEVNVPADWAQHVWEELMTAGEPHGITPYGTETMHVLRAEKGYVIVGQDTDGSVTPLDLGLGAMVASGKDCLGKRSLARPDLRRPDRKQLVGLLPEDPRVVLPEGGQVVADPAAAPPVPMLGHVTSSYASATLGRSFALALVKAGRERHGQRLQVVRRDGSAVAVRVVSPVFYDPEGARQHV